MTTTDHERWADAAGAYVLGAMPRDERAAYESHLATCTACQHDVDELRPAAEALPMASPPIQPPAALKDRIMAEVEREAALLAQAGPMADRRPAREGGRRRRFLPSLGAWRFAPVAATALIVGALGGALLTGSDTREVRFQGADATLEVTGDEAKIVAQNLPAPPEGRVYEVWLMPEGSETPEPTDVLFVPRSDGAAVAAIPSVDDVRQVLVSDEPPGGSEEPTGEVLMSADLS